MNLPPLDHYDVIPLPTPVECEELQINNLMQLYLRRTGTLHLHYLVVAKCVIKILSFLFSYEDAPKILLFVVCFVADYGRGNVSKEMCLIPFYIADLFHYSYEEKVIQRLGHKKNEITSCGPQLDF